MKKLLVMIMMMRMRIRMRRWWRRRMRMSGRRMKSRRDRRKTDIYKRTLFSVYFILFETHSLLEVCIGLKYHSWT
jgi:hypothetical protein